MRTLSYISVIALAATLLQACKGNKTGSTTDSTVTSTTTTSVVIDSLKNVITDSIFYSKAAVGGITEVTLGKLALSKSSDAEIRNFANMMVSDHGKANAELVAIAKAKNVTLPAAPDADHQAKIDSLAQLTGKDFDKAYVATMVEGHQKTLNLMRDEATRGKDTELKAFADKTSPVVQMHLEMINKIHDGMK